MDELEQIQAQIEELQKKAQEIAQSKRSHALETLKKEIKLYNFSAKDLGFTAFEKNDSKKRPPVPIKYRKGENTWTGRGRKPRWLEEHAASGGRIEDFLV